MISESFNYAPCFADLDNDGDNDLLLGSYLRDSLWFFRNTGTLKILISLSSHGDIRSDLLLWDKAARRLCGH
ncbi:MAG: FG-GAP repeat protein [Ignavibacteria bacterium]|nr:FG-GAP repeat protein [Ignavibacteria bacterium]